MSLENLPWYWGLHTKKKAQATSEQTLVKAFTGVFKSLGKLQQVADELEEKHEK